jgi:hypothetical protein
MEIQGHTNADRTEIHITVKCEDINEFNGFNHFFEDMMKRMAEHADQVVIDPINNKVMGGDDLSESEAFKALKEFAIESAIKRNQDSSVDFRSKFI